nr:integrase, catalytic region, zinc finger, CCHC-type, peptidase aspartic, catalytic [Tanacetum cinerariifolium]
MTGNHALLTNFVEKFLGTVRFGNNDFAVIAGYGDVVIGSMTIKKVYYVEGLDLLNDDRSSNLYTIALNEIASNSLDCLLAKASFLQSWLWHQLQHVRTDNGMEFKNKTLATFFDEVRISQKISTVRTPQQNGVVERRNRTLVEAAKVNIEVFVGYAKDSATFRVYNKQTQKIYEREVFHEVSESLQGESSSSSINDDVQTSEEVIVPQTNTQSISNDKISNVNDANSSHNVVNEQVEDAYFDASIVFHDTSNVYEFYQPYPHEQK